jgi:hypothetical protein
MKLADGILKNRQSNEFIDFLFSFSVSLSFSCNLIGCQFGDFDVIFMTLFLKSNINCIQPQGQPPPPPPQ